MRSLLAAIVGCVFLLPAAGAAQAPRESPVHWICHPPEKAVHAGDAFEIKLEVKIDGEWHLYSATTPPGGPNPTRFSVISGEPFKMAGPVRQSPPTTQFDSTFGIETEYYSGSAEFWMLVGVSGSAAPGEYEIRLQTVYQVCNDKVCLPPTKVPISAKINISKGDPSSPGAQGA